MRIFKFILTLGLTIAAIYGLNTKFGQFPPFGKLLDPYGGFWQNAESDFSAPETINLSGLTANVEVVYDSALIPHIYAENNADLYFAQGYVAASLRLWQLEFQTYAAAGRLTEIVGVGPNGVVLDLDRTARRQGLVFGAENSMKKMLENPLIKEMVEGYAAGVNAYIESLSYADFPLEYKILDYAPEEWTTLKTGLLLSYMSNTLNRSEKDLQNTNFLKLHGLEMLDLIYPDNESQEDAVVVEPGAWDFDPITIDSIPLALPDELITNDLVPSPDPNNGSNNWAVSGTKSESGYPILAGDPHLDLSLPSIWLTMQLNAPGINTMGAALLGTPGIIIGFNDSIAWTVTNAQRDLVDWYKIEFQDESRDRYLLDGIWVPTQKNIEEFKIKGAESYYDTIVYTHWGPVVYDKNFRPGSEKSSYAMRWTAHDESEELRAFYGLNTANNFDDYMAALNYFSAPGQNFAFASVGGDIAMRVQGKYPVRRMNEGRFLLDGSKSSNGWQAFIPNEHHAFTKNPARNYVSSANQHPVDSTYPYYVTASSYPNFRNRRINMVLDSLDQVTVQDMMDLQNDNYNLTAADVLPYLLDTLQSQDFNQEQLAIFNALRRWDYYNNPESEAASFFEEWWDTLYIMIWDEIRNSNRQGVRLQYPTDFSTIRLLKDSVALSFFDNKSTDRIENAIDIINMSFIEAVEDISEWKHKNGEKVRWADYNNTTIAHLSRSIPPFGRQVETGGNHGIVNATTRGNGPSWRMIVSLEKPKIRAWGVYPGGQSGNPGSPYYDNMVDMWANGQYLQLIFVNSPEQVVNPLLKQNLEPSN